MKAIPATGPSPQKAKFFAETASAFELLSLFYELPVEDQRQLVELLQSYHAVVYNAKQKQAPK